MGIHSMKRRVEDGRDFRLGLIMQMLKEIFMEMLTTPFGGMFPCVSIEQAKVALSSDVVKIGHKRMRIFHRASVSFIFCHSNLICLGM
jgi:hypothetical protein